MLYLIRHAKDDENYVGSWSNREILEEEKDNVEEQAKYIKRNLTISNIYSSDIRRAEQTAEIIAKELNKEVIIDPNLREQNKGTLTGRLKSELSEEEAYMLKHQEIDTVFKEGESLIDVYNRIKTYMSEMKNYKDNSLVVTHRGVINMFYYILNNISLDMDKKKFNVDHLSIHELDLENKKIRRIK